MDTEIEGFSQPEIIPQTHQIACTAIGIQIIVFIRILIIYQDGQPPADFDKEALFPGIIRKRGKIIVDLI